MQLFNVYRFYIYKKDMEILALWTETVFFFNLELLASQFKRS